MGFGVEKNGFFDMGALNSRWIEGNKKKWCKGVIVRQPLLKMRVFQDG